MSLRFFFPSNALIPRGSGSSHIHHANYPGLDFTTEQLVGRNAPNHFTIDNTLHVPPECNNVSVVLLYDSFNIATLDPEFWEHVLRTKKHKEYGLTEQECIALGSG